MLPLLSIPLSFIPLSYLQIAAKQAELVRTTLRLCSLSGTHSVLQEQLQKEHDQINKKN